MTILGNPLLNSVVQGVQNSQKTTPSDGYTVGNWFQRNFDSGLLDIQNSAYQSKIDREFNEAMQDKANAFSSAEAEKNRAWQEKMLGLSNEFSASEAEKNRAWQEQMSNTAYSRAVQDLKNAGLNPYLAATGMQSTTPSGSTARSGGYSSSSAHGVSSSSSGRIGSGYSSGGQKLLSFLSSIAGFGLSAYSMAARNALMADHYANMERLREIEIASRW